MRSPIQWNLRNIFRGLLITSLIGLLFYSVVFAQSPTATPSPTIAPLSPLAVPSPIPQPGSAIYPAIPTYPASVLYLEQGDYEGVGDLWVKTLPDGEPHRLTDNGSNFTLSWSPSGQSVSSLFEPSFPNIRVMDRDGRGGIIWGGAVYAGHAWSPVADRLAYGVGAEIWVSGTPIVRQADIATTIGITGQIGKLAWSPDGEQIAFTWQAQQADGGIVQDSLWVVDSRGPEAEGGKPLQVLEGNVPAVGEIILRGWSGDGKYLLYWQAPILSASILADGVPLYALPINGGEPKLIADAVLVHDEAVQVQPDSDTIAVVVGGGRAVWTGKSLQLISLNALQPTTQPKVLSPSDQSAASPVWSPNGQQIAYVGMPDATDAVAGGSEAEETLQQRRIWLVNTQTDEMIQITGLITDVAGSNETAYRDEAPQWVDEDTLLFARLDAEGHLSLWTIDTNGTNLQQVVEEITPAPEWFGYYGYIDWSYYFALWQPAMAEKMIAQMQEQASRPAAFPPLGYERQTHPLGSFLALLHQNLTPEEAVATWGDPEMSSNSWDDSIGEEWIIYQYALDDDSRIRLGFLNEGPLDFVQVQHVNGRVFVLTPLEEVAASANQAALPTPPSLFGTATAFPTPMQASSQSPLATPTPIP